MRERVPCVYLLASARHGTLYVGVTAALAARVAQHLCGNADSFTKRYEVTRLVWYETAEMMVDAIAAEKRIKRWPRQWKFNLIERDNPHWDDLAAGLGLPPLRG
ncbi:GIY-YIG nuclease family protein [Sphingomonas sp. BK069]|uniref:GIY-YIG nuclease family protein n=1 Tax=Sphingomonas sp. BK069 TaxID=2586979 RepID=UPI0016104CF1|nr:GIY-YIG nuclease family protein [Sphingomonas sp. BK069]MBB3347102.1 putative endonuclease [Sphingomonas sp. BK069]